MTNSATHTYRIVLVEDSIEDAEIIAYELKKAGFAFTLSRVETERDYLPLLRRERPDIVLSDYHLPQFSGKRALELLLEHDHEIPFLLVSGAVGDEIAVEMLRSGCVDYVLKEKLTRLPSAVVRAVQEARSKREKRIALDALKESEVRFRKIADNSPMLIWMSDVNRKVNYVNATWCRFTGRSADEEWGDGWLENIHPEDLRRFLPEYAMAFERREPFTSEYRMLYHDGSYRWLYSTGIPNYLPGGELIGYIGSSIDITERKQTEESLRRTTEMLDTFFNQSLDACYFIQFRHPLAWADTADRQGVLADLFDTAILSRFNHALMNQYRLSQEEIQRIHPKDIFGSDAVKMEHFFTQLFDVGAMYYSTTMQRKDGSEIVMEGNAVCTYDDHRKITGFFGIQRDVTQSVREKEDLQRDQERYKKFFEEDMTGDFITKTDGTIVMCNQAFARIFGFSSVEEACTVNASILYRDADERRKWLKTIQAEKKVERYPVFCRRKNGEEFLSSMTAIAHFSTSGAIEEVVGYIVDDTRRQEMESQMIQAQKMESIGELASGVAHDFNNILNNIFGFSQQLVKYHKDPVRVMRYTETIAKSAQRGTEIASKLLSFARQRKTETGVIAVADIVGDVVQICRETFMHSIAIESGGDSEPWRVQGDRSGLYQMLLNICMNARDAIVEQTSQEYSGLLHIDVNNRTEPIPHLHWFRDTPPSRFIEIIVRDNGVGIPQPVIDKIFDPFFSTKKQNQQKGTGLGLTVVYNIVKSHHGAIQVKSEEGKGSEFHIFLPAVEYSTPEKPGAAENQYRSRHGELVLLVDDEDGMLELGGELLTENGYRVLTASNGMDAIALMERHKEEIDLVVLDLVMPGIDGGQTYLRMKKIQPDLKAFFCSGFVTDSLLSNVLAEEHLSALQKPFRQEQFLKFVHATLYP